VGAYTEVRDKAKAFEEDHGLRFDANGTVEISNWKTKVPKLMWRGVPMVDVRQVRFLVLSRCLAHDVGTHEGKRKPAMDGCAVARLGKS
jgi:hypothetical protein